jgi:hypothetical protein
MTIEDFHALLTSDSEENALLAALRKLMAIEKVEEVVVAISSAQLFWVR